MTGLTLDRAERDVLDGVDGRADGMIATVKDWARVNSGSRNAAGLERMRALIAEAFAETGAQIEAVELAPSLTVESDGEIREIAYTPAMKAVMRPDAPASVSSRCAKIRSSFSRFGRSAKTLAKEAWPVPRSSISISIPRS